MKISIARTPTDINQFDSVEMNSVHALAEAACKSNISTSIFLNGYRNIENFSIAHCIGLDIDNDNKKGTPSLTLDAAKRTFAGFKHAILSTRSHGAEKNGIIADRFRVILFVETPIVLANDFYATWHWLKDQFPWIDNQCKDPSRFWYQHKSVLSINEEGTLITPIRYTEPTKPEKDGRAVLPGERGELSKSTLQFLEFGVEAGSRNGSVYKVAREFQQALYDHEETETRILAALERNKVFQRDFTESEAKITIRSAFSKDAKHAPRLSDIKQRAFYYRRWEELEAEPDLPEDWLVEGLLLRGGLSVIVGMPKIGKSTLIRQLEKCILRGESFLKRKTTKGTVVHFSFDEKAKTAKRHYRLLGLTKTDNLVLHFGTANHEGHLKELEEDFLKIKPAIAVVDTLFDMANVNDVNDYGSVKRMLTFFSSLAERTNCHIMFIHHQNKPNKDYGTGSGHTVLGSTAIFGSVDCCLIFERGKNPDIRTLAVQGRAIDDFSNLQLRFDRKAQTYKVESIEDEF